MTMKTVYSTDITYKNQKLRKSLKFLKNKYFCSICFIYAVFSEMSPTFFLDKNGWNANDMTMIFANMAHKKLEIKKPYFTTEYTSYGVCHVLNDIPPQMFEGQGNGLKLGLNILQSTYSEFVVSDDDILGTNAGVKVFLGPLESTYGISSKKKV